MKRYFSLKVRLIPGNIYYLVIDGNVGDICDFEVQV